MKLLTLVLCSALMVGFGCGGGGSAGGGKYNIVQAKHDTAILLKVRVTPTGKQDGLDSVWVAMTQVPCTPVKARYDMSKAEFFDAKCGETAIQFLQSKKDGALGMTCEMAVGVDACKNLLNKILNSARDARYIK